MTDKTKPAVSFPGPRVVTPEIAQMQAWTRRIEKILGHVTPISYNVAVRTEFTGVGTAEESVKACTAMFNQSKEKSSQIHVDFQSMGDWNAASRYCAEQNLPCVCRFSDIMELASESLKFKLLADKFEKAGYENLET